MEPSTTRPVPPGPGGDGGAEVVADEGAALDLAEELDHEHVALLQGVDDPRVLAAHALVALALLLHQLLQVGPLGHVAAGDGAAHQDALRVQVQPVALVLQPEVVPHQHAPGLLGGHLLHAFQDVVGHQGPAEPVPGKGAVPGEFGIALRGVQFHLSSRFVRVRFRILPDRIGTIRLPGHGAAAVAGALPIA